MSISNLQINNNYDLFSRSLNVKEFIAEALETLNLDVTGELIADKIIANSGFNYLAPWSGGANAKDYITNDLVIYNNQIWRCLVANSNVQPDPNNPAQVEWVPISSNNAILSDRQYVQLHLTNGNDVKGLISAIPFQTIPAALLYLKSVGGGYAKIMSVGQNNVYGDGSDLTLFEYDNIILDCGDASVSYLNNPQNKINYRLLFQQSDNVTIKNCCISRENTSPNVFYTAGCKNISLENITIIDQPDAPIPIISVVGPSVDNTFGSHTFTNCYLTPSDDIVCRLVIDGFCGSGTTILIDNTGLIYQSSFRIGTTGIDASSYLNFRLIVRNSYIDAAVMTHYTGMTFIFENCIIKGALTSAATSGSLTLINCSFFDPGPNTWGSLNLSGTAQYKLIDCFTNPNSSADVINISGNVNSLNYTMGPAARFNRLVTWAGGAPTSTGAAQAIVQILSGNIMTNAWNILTYNAGTGAITFLTPGVYQLLISLSVQNTNTANEQTVLHCFFGASGSNEGSALALTATDRGFVGSAPILAAYPNSRRGVALFFQVSTIATPYFFYVRNLSGVAYNVTIEAMSILQIR